MDDLRNILIELTNKHSMINFGRMLEVRYHDLYEKVNRHPVGNSFNEKVYCIVNELSEIPYNQILNKHYTFINYTKGYGNYDLIITEFSDNDIKYLKDNVKFDKTVKRYKPNLYYLVLQKTKFLDDKVSLQERVYCILNNITIRPDGKFYDLDKGYSTEEDDKLNYIISLANKVGSNDIKHGRKINEFLKRNIKNNYKGIEGYDYVVCPVLNVKMNMIKSNYIENYLLMTVEDFEKKYPNTKRTCDKRIENIKNGIHEIDQETGKTKHQLAMKKAVITKNIVGEDGKTINDKIGEKTRATHMSKIDENGMNGYNRIAKISRPKQIETMARNNLCSSIDEKYHWNCYRNFVVWLTSPKKKDLLDGRKSGKAGTKGAYHVDHIYSNILGFKNSISPFDLVHNNNLRVIPWEENVRKNRHSDITLEEFMLLINQTLNDSNSDFNNFIKILDDMKRSNEEFSSITVMERWNKLIY